MIMEADWADWGASNYETFCRATFSAPVPAAVASSSSNGNSVYPDQTDGDQGQYYQNFYGGLSGDLEDYDQNGYHSSRCRKRRRDNGGRDHSSSSGNSSSSHGNGDRRDGSRDRGIRNKLNKKLGYGNGDDLIDQVLSWSVGEGILS